MADTKTPAPGASPNEKKVLKQPVFTVQHNRLKMTRLGPILYNIHDQLIAPSLEFYGEYGTSTQQLYAQLVKQGDTVVDVGANLGIMSVFFGKLVGPGGAVYSFEPQRVIYQLLCANVAMNGLQNVHAYRAAAGEKVEESRLPVIDYTKPGNFVNIRTDKKEKGETVSLAPLDDMKLAKCHFMRISTHGNEVAALKGAEKTIKKHQPILHVENGFEKTSPQIIETLSSFGYDLFWHVPFVFNPDNYFGNKQNGFGAMVSVYVLALPRGFAKNTDSLPRVLGPEDDWRRLVQKPEGGQAADGKSPPPKKK